MGRSPHLGTETGQERRGCEHPADAVPGDGTGALNQAGGKNERPISRRAA